MAEANDVPMEDVSEKVALENHTNNTSPEKIPVKEDSAADVSMEPLEKDESKAVANSDNTGKAKYTEEERLKRKEYFKQLREKRRLAREKYSQNYRKKMSRNPIAANASRLPLSKDVVISFNMTEEEQKMLDFYKMRMTMLKGENEQLHRRLASLVKENMRLLQMGPAPLAV